MSPYYINKQINEDEEKVPPDSRIPSKNSSFNTVDTVKTALMDAKTKAVLLRKKVLQY